MAKRRLCGLLIAWLTAVSLLPAEEQKPDEGLNALVEVLRQSDDPQFHYDILKGMNDGLKGRRGLKMPQGWDELSARLNQSSNAQVRELAQSLSVTFGSASALTALRKKLVDRGASISSRQSALDALVQAKDPNLPATLQGLLGEASMLAAILRALAAYDDPKTPDAVLRIYPGLSTADKQHALNTLASRATFARRLLNAVDKNVVPRADLTADIVRQLRSLKDSRIDTQVQKLWGIARESEAEKVAEIARFKAMIQNKGIGDPSRGRAIFARTCQQCHILFDTGGKAGPDITGSNRGELDYILQNIIDPNAIIPNDYRTSTLETKDERIITGIVTKQDANAITIVVPNETIVVSRGDVKSLTQGDVSMMPEGLLAALSQDEVRDLIGYLRSPVQVPMKAISDRTEK